MTDNELTSRHCQSCQKGYPPLPPAQVQQLLVRLQGDWSVDADSSEISRTYVNALAWIAHGEDNHPDIEVGYNRCHVRFSTHTIGGLSDNDLICAAKIDALLPATT